MISTMTLRIHEQFLEVTGVSACALGHQEQWRSVTYKPNEYNDISPAKLEPVHQPRTHPPESWTEA